jgi:protease I
MKLRGKRIAILAGELYEDLELWYPYYRLLEEGAKVELVGKGGGPDVVNSKHGYPAAVDLPASRAKAQDYDAVIVPGGYGPDHLRRCRHVIGLVQELFKQGKLVAFICHGGWVPATAEILAGKKVTSVFAIKADMVHAGAAWLDEEVVVDGNMISSRMPADLPAFMRAIIDYLAQ